ncbi:MAG TPA: hypothetical protein VGB84_03490 [Arachidicoccus sp.]
MPINPKYLADFEENEIYHVYNRTNNKEPLFLNDGHRSYFLKRYAEIVSPLLETFAWTLLDNHFHFLIKVKSYDHIWDFYDHLHKNETELTQSEIRFLNEEIGLSELVEFTFKRFFQSYAQAFNKNVNRKGSLFSKRFKRVKVDRDKHLMQTVIYIHANAVKHGLITDFTQYKWSSWHSFINENKQIIEYDFISDFFGGTIELQEIHFLQVQRYIDYVSEMDD